MTRRFLFIYAFVVFLVALVVTFVCVRVARGGTGPLAPGFTPVVDQAGRTSLCHPGGGCVDVLPGPYVLRRGL